MVHEHKSVRRWDSKLRVVEWQSWSCDGSRWFAWTARARRARASWVQQLELSSLNQEGFGLVLHVSRSKCAYELAPPIDPAFFCNPGTVDGLPPPLVSTKLCGRGRATFPEQPPRVRRSSLALVLHRAGLHVIPLLVALILRTVYNAS